MERIPRAVVAYTENDPRAVRGGVETHAKNLGLVFEEVLFMTPATRDEALVVARRLPVICDNQRVLDWPERVPVIGIQHGMASRKLLSTRSFGDAKMALAQARAARRRNTLWIAAANWVRDAFTRHYRVRARHVVYHGIDLERFDGELANAGSRVLLHDARSPHKGSHLYPVLARALPDWRFELLGAGGEPIPEHMRRARAFLHLSRYEGNSLVVCEAMAMNLPCLFTEVGLMLDGTERFDVTVVPRRAVFGPERRLIRTVSEFVAGLDRRDYRPRAWVEEHASFDANRAAWRRVLDDFDATARW
ncbi:MAG: glycosyltransferase [Sorangiineae bacterium]|nr:glycosyltransferase [Polyangiaceae bacterium]MEB2324093.1 glycosyltransferase [Sorangiineae bacterium]